jgi:hypothetical protein
MVLMTTPDLRARAAKYATNNGTELEKPLGFGSDGSVWQTLRKTAIKVFEKRHVYENELSVYQRFQRDRVRSLAGFAIPVLLQCDHDLMVIEMSIVEKPYILDFGKVYLDTPPDFSSEVMGDFFANQKERWGKKYWPQIAKLWGLLKSHGVFHMDPKPGNIELADYVPDDD